ncbi:alpha/beta fold hydrolase [Xylophilus sp. GW821-FHT01B05]
METAATRRKLGSWVRGLAIGWLLLGLAGARADTPGYTEQPLALATATGALQGSLVLPEGRARMPVVLIIAGSGPTDRNGNSSLLPGPSNSLKMLAAALAEAGFASLRYDKRGIAASAPAAAREADLRFDLYVQDAADWVRLLRADSRFSAVAVVGHSEGSLIGMLAARQAGAQAFVSIAGPAQGAAAVLRQQFARKQLPPDLAARNEAILSALEQGRPAADVPQSLALFYRPGIQPYLISWFSHVPATEFAQLGIPTLVLQGDTDTQVRTDEAEALQRAKPDTELRIVKGMNHVLKLVPADPALQRASSSDPTLPLAPELPRAIARFLSRVLPAK